MKIDITFNVYTDANGGDPDSTSPTLRSYHKMLWSKKLPNADKKSGTYLYHNRYKNFFDLFDNFKGYIDFFLLNDLIDENENIKFYLPFDNFKTKPTFADIEEYLTYKKGVMDFIKARNKRIDNYANQQTTEQNASH
jgi:hypothetical protein